VFNVEHESMCHTWFCFAVSEDYLGEYVCNVTDRTGESVSKTVYLWCMYSSCLLTSH